MSKTSSKRRLQKPQFGVLANLDKEELERIRVVIKRSNILDPDNRSTILRDIDNPNLVELPRREDEGKRPIFDRDDLVVNQIVEERIILTQRPFGGHESGDGHSPRIIYKNQSRSRSHSPRRLTSRSDHGHFSLSKSSRSTGKRPFSSSSSAAAAAALAPSIGGGSSRDQHKKYRQSSRRSRSRSYESPPRGRRLSPHRDRGRHGSRSPKYRTAPRTPPRSETRDRRSRTRSPPRRGRSTSRSPQRRRHSSRSPPSYRHHRSTSSTSSSRHRSRRSRTPPDYPSKTAPPPSSSTGHVPPPELAAFYQGDQFWIPAPAPLQPGFIPRGFLPPPHASFPRPDHIMLPRIPLLPPQHPQFRARLPVYNSRPRKPRGQSTASAPAQSTTSTPSQTAITAATSSGEAPSSTTVARTTVAPSDSSSGGGGGGGSGNVVGESQENDGAASSDCGGTGE